MICVKLKGKRVLFSVKLLIFIRFQSKIDKVLKLNFLFIYFIKYIKNPNFPIRLNHHIG